MKRKWLYLALVGSSVCCAVALAILTTDDVAADPPITCTFECNNGIDYYLPNCQEGSLNACCALAAPACENDEGLESGICQKGRLGLPCQPFDP